MRTRGFTIFEMVAVIAILGAGMLVAFDLLAARQAVADRAERAQKAYKLLTGEMEYQWLVLYGDLQDTNWETVAEDPRFELKQEVDDVNSGLARLVTLSIRWQEPGLKHGERVKSVFTIRGNPQ